MTLGKSLMEYCRNLAERALGGRRIEFGDVYQVNGCSTERFAAAKDLADVEAPVESALLNAVRALTKQDRPEA